MDIVINNAKLRDKQYGVNIGINDGIIQSIIPANSESSQKNINEAGHIIDASGKLVTPSFIDPHLHMDKALIAEEVRDNFSGTLAEAIEIIWDKKKNYTHEEVIDRASRVIKMGLRNGTKFFRTHVDVDTIIGMKGIEALLEVRKQFTGIADIQIVAFPQEGIIKNPGADKLMRKAMKLGANVVGGMPYNEYNSQDSMKQIDFCFNLARAFNADIDMHVDETDDPSARTLEYLAKKTIDTQWFGRVSAGHTCALAAYNDSYADKIIGMVKLAQMNMITNPATNLMLQGRLDKQPKRRGITRVKELLEAGINVAFGQDCIKDTFYPTWGREDMLEVGLITAHAAQLSQPAEIEVLFDMPTSNSAKIMRLDEYGIYEGAPANLNVIDAATIQEAFRTNADRLFVISSGKIIATNKTERSLNI
ncbi:amidohydrolase family protein [Elusimicrobiota bacterium]